MSGLTALGFSPGNLFTFVTSGSAESAAKKADEETANLLEKLAVPDNRLNFFTGVFHVSQTALADPECRQVYSNVSQSSPYFFDAALGTADGFAADFVQYLNLMIKVEKIMSEMKKEGPLRRCLSFTDKDVHVFLVKLLLFKQDLTANTDKNLIVVKSIAKAALAFKQEKYFESGSSLAEALKAVIATEVSIPDSEILQIQLVPCLLKVFKTRSEITQEPNEAVLESMTRAGAAARATCINFK